MPRFRVPPARAGQRVDALDGGAIRRGQRVCTLLAGIVILSIADFVVTVGHLRTVGMVEANPIASWLIETTRSPWALAGYKVLTVGICVSLLYRVRRERIAECAAWFGLSILVGMCFIWHTYSVQLDHPGQITLVQADDGWQYLE